MADWIIVVDDDIANLKMAGHILSKNGMRVTALKSGTLLIDYVREHGLPDMVLLDILMPDMDGFETLIHLRKYEKETDHQPTPVVFLTADEDKSVEMRGFQMGVSDFVRKPFDPDVLTQRIIHIIADNRKIMNITEEATKDGLTGFLNKESTRDRIEAMVKNDTGALCVIDLDSFKLVNDIYGHEMGDRVLVRFSEIVNAHMGEGSVCGRIGGDEFLMFGLNMRRESDIIAFSKAINDELVAAARQLMGEDMRIPLGASIGAVSVPQQGTDYDDLFSMADKTLYLVKDRGKHGYAMYRDETEDLLSGGVRDMDLKTVSKLLEERSIPQSVMWMGREAFSNVYRYMMRYLERYDVYAYKVLFTLHFTDDDISINLRDRVIEALRDVIKVSLRNSDIMVQISSEQFFLLLPELSPEHVDRVIGRMVNAWYKNELSANTELKYEYSGATSGDNGRQYTPGGGYHIVVVDDDGTNLKMAEHILAQEGMQVTCLRSGQALLDYLQENDPTLILLDVNMPQMDGFETMQRLTSKGGRVSRIPVIFLTGTDDDSTETHGFAMGAMDFIRKPFVPEILIVRVRHAIELIRLQNSLKSEVSEKVEENERLSMHIIQALAASIDAKDKYTSGHSGRVAEYSKEISARYGYDYDSQNNIYMMALLHDVGKIGVPDHVINKQGKLTDDEYEQIKKHPELGDQILKKIIEMPGLCTGARWHHERYDGQGYPDRLSGGAIPEAARIIAVADAYDAMSSRRSYRDVMPQAKVRAEIERCRGTQFDPVFADIMLSMIDDDPEYRMREDY
ncbi:MAG: response regulator [Lachnospiraceae bacterium]|nr:response regulator [Lachnospiraceae bacterium]